MSQRRILIIEDNEDLAKLIALCLEERKFQVDFALDGETGLQKISRQPPDLIILDLNLPVLSGEEVCRHIRQDEREKISQIPILVLTGKNSDVDRIVTRVIGADQFMTKPFELGELMEQISCLLHIGPQAA